MPGPLWRCLGPNKPNDAEPEQIFPDRSSFLALAAISAGRAGSDAPPGAVSVWRGPRRRPLGFPVWTGRRARIQRLRFDLLDPGERFVRLVGGRIRGPGRNLRAAVAAEDVEVVHGVANEQGIVERGIEDTVAIGVAGGVNRAEPSRHVELVAVVEGDHLRHLGLLCRSVGDHVAQRTAPL